jgi:DNA-binding FadR family transcriptional regulator
MPGTDDHLFTPVRAVRASEAIISQIEDRIFRRELQPGDRLAPERELARQFGVSRITIRDALRSLESRGFISVRVGAGGGAIVREPDIAAVGETIYDMLRRQQITLSELIEARNIVEPAIAEIAAHNATPEDLAAMRQTVTQAEEALGTRPFMPSSIAFHVALAAASHNTVLAATIYALRTTFYAALAELRQPVAEMPQVAIRGHQEIIEAIEARDGARARQLMSEHLRYFDEHVRAVLGEAMDQPVAFISAFQRASANPAGAQPGVAAAELGVREGNPGATPSASSTAGEAGRRRRG